MEKLLAPVVLGLGLWVANVPTATAGVQLSRYPAGWVDEPSREANDRAVRWATGGDGELDLVLSTEDADGFAETLALIEVDAALPIEALSDPAGALMQNAAVMLSTDALPETATSQARTDGSFVVTGQWTLDGVVHRVGLVSSGATHSVVVMAVRSSERSLYAPAFDLVLEDLEGVAPPIPPFDVGRFRMAMIVGWIAVAMIELGAVWIGRRRAPLQKGRVAAGLTSIVAMLAGIWVYSMLLDDVVRLAVARSNPTELAVETIVAGLVVGVIVLLGAAAQQARLRPVRSAPPEGAFAERSHASLRIAEANRRRGSKRDFDDDETPTLGG